MTTLRPPFLASALALIGSICAPASAGGVAVGPLRIPRPPLVLPAVVLNEIDADQQGIDDREFIELYTPDGAVDLSHLFLVLYNGSDNQDRAYDVIDLYGTGTGDNGLFVVGSEKVGSADLVAFSVNGLQNGLDAVALWFAPGLTAAAFQGTPAATPPIGAVLVDALVYGSSPGGDPELLAALAPAPEVVTEGSGGDAGLHSLQRLPDGTQAFQTHQLVATVPTPGELNGQPLLATIHDIQGAGHRSPLEGAYVVDVIGVVTTARSDRFTLQTVPGLEDDDPATSEGLTVLSGRRTPPQIGDRLRVSGWIEEHRPGGVAKNLSTTRLRALGEWELLAVDQPLPDPVILGTGGRLPPDRIVDDDTFGQVGESTAVFDPRRDGLDFYESLESMRVRVNDARAVGPRSKFGEIPIVGDGGRYASTLGPRGALVRTRGDDQPERILVDDVFMPTPDVHLGDGFDLPLTGVIDYSFGNYKLLLTEAVRGRARGPSLQALPPARRDQLRVASVNVQNLAATSDARRIAALGRQIVAGLGAPDIIALQEIQDDNGPVNDGTVSALQTLDRLVEAIAAEGGPAYDSWNIDPADGRDGGQPGGNIRVAYLVRSDRGVHVEYRPGATATTPTTIEVDVRGQPRLVPNPGRVAPNHFSWDGSRKPLALEISWRNQRWFLINVHLVSKGGDSPLFGSFQPPVLASEVKRLAQVEVLAAFAAEIFALDPDARVVLLGDFNDFVDSAPLAVLDENPLLENLIGRLARGDRYTYIYQGTAQVLDHVIVSAGVVAGAASLQIDAVHGNAERPDGTSDHDPIALTVGWSGDGRSATIDGLR